MSRGRGSWVWVNVVGKKSLTKKLQSKVIEKKIEKSCKIFMKLKSPTP